MSKCCKYICSLNKIIGIVLASSGIGIIFGIILPWWSIFIAVAIFLLGLILIIIN